MKTKFLVIFNIHLICKHPAGILLFRSQLIGKREDTFAKALELKDVMLENTSDVSTKTLTTVYEGDRNYRLS